MKISILSDLHFGYGRGTEIEEDTYEAMIEALEKASGSDIILLGGDIFDTKVPSNETLVRAMELLRKPLSEEATVTLFRGTGKDISEIAPMALAGTPVISIHGTHERRARGLLNPVQLLEKAGFIVYLDKNGVIFQKGNEKLCVQGLSGVPDQHTEEVLNEWSPKPIPDCINIFMIHQNLTDFMHEKVPYTLDTDRLPKGFDFYVCGHIHSTLKKEYKGGVILLPGSLIPTELTKDSGEETGFWQIDSETKKVNFIRLENHRRIYYRELDSSAGAEAIEKEIKEILKKPHKKKPLIRIKLKGKQADLPLKNIETKFEDKIIVSFKKDFEKDSLPEARSLEEHKLSVQELGRKIMKENLKELKLDENLFEAVFELLLEKRADDALRLLRNPSKKESLEPQEQQKKEQPAEAKETEAEKKPEAVPEKPAEPTEPKPKEVPGDWKQFLKGA